MPVRNRTILSYPYWPTRSVTGNYHHNTILTLIRLSRKGRSTPWSLVTSDSLSATSAALNQESKSSAELNTSGSRKLSSDHSSWRLFCSGVPVSRRRFCDLNVRTTSDSCNDPNDINRCIADRQEPTSFRSQRASGMTLFRPNLSVATRFGQHYEGRQGLRQIPHFTTGPAMYLWWVTKHQRIPKPITQWISQSIVVLSECW